jgi:hypothetical protein
MIVILLCFYLHQYKHRFSLNTNLILFQIVKLHVLILYMDHQTHEVNKTLKDTRKNTQSTKQTLFQNKNYTFNTSPERFYRIQKVESEHQI